MRFQLKNLHNIEWYDTDNIKQLEKWGFTIIQANCRSEKYMQDFHKASLMKISTSALICFTIG